MNGCSDDFLSAWPARRGLDLGSLRRAECRAIAAMKDWHKSGDHDVTIFRGISLGRLWRAELSTTIMSLYRRAALGKLTSRGPETQWDPRKYNPGLSTVTRVRREDFKSRSFRLLSRLASALPLDAEGYSVLMLASPSNRSIRRAWLEGVAGKSLRLDIDMNLPPNPRDALLSLLRGAHVFDPEPVELDEAARVEIRTVIGAVEQLAQDAAWNAKLEFAGQKLAPFMEKLVVRPFTAAVEDLARKRVSFEREFDRLKPRLVLVPHEVDADSHILLRLAQQRGIPFWHINHGYPAAGYRFEQNPGTGDLESDLINAWGPEDKENYLRAGVPPERIAVTGHPAFDALLPLAPARPFSGVRGTSVLVAAATTMAYARAAHYEDIEEFQFREIVGLLDRLEAARIVIKLHPGRPRPDFYQGLLNTMSPRARVEIRHEGNFTDALATCDWALGGPTTALFETILSGKDYFFVDYQPCDFPLPFKYDQTFVAKSSAELERNIREGRPVPRERIVRDFCGFDGSEKPWHASSRILGLVEARLAGAPEAATRPRMLESE